MGYRVKDWAKFQHFKDRSPPWVKLYRDILDDPDWHDLDAESSKALVMIWLIASEDKEMRGQLPETRKLAFRLRMTEAKLKQTLTKLSHYLDCDDIDMISARYQDDIPETERETETEKRRGREQRALSRPENVSEQVWSDFLSQRKQLKADLTVTALEGIKREADKIGWSLEQALVECTVRGWRGFKAEWINKPQGGRNGHDKRDGFTKALDAALGLDEFAGAPGRQHDEPIDGFVALPPARPSRLS